MLRLEQETIINFNREEDYMTVYTADPFLLAKLEKSGEYEKVQEDKQGGQVVAATFKASKKMLTIRMKRPARREMTDEEKKAAAERLRNSCF